METLLPDLQRWFQQKSDYFSVFAQQDTRLEGWFKGELLLFFEKQKQKEVVIKYQCEVQPPHSPERIDFKIDLQNQEHWLELKVLSIGRVKTKRGLPFYFGEDRGLVKDFKKLENFTTLPHKWVLAFVYPLRNIEEWHSQIKQLPADWPHWQQVTEHILPTECLLSLWQYQL
jgi:hypothetical protein